MPSERHFVGRKAELHAFRLALEDPAGQAILITGGQGMGKSFLARRMVEEAEQHPTLQCGAIRYEVTATDSVESVMALMLDHAFDAAPGAEGSFAPSPRRREQWRTLFETVLPKGRDLVALVAAVRRDPARSSREQLVAALGAVSEQMPETARVIFLIDAEKEMPEKSDQAWAAVVRQLPPKIKLLFPQRPYDALADSYEFGRLHNVLRIPDQPLGSLAPHEVDELLGLFGDDLPAPIEEVRRHLTRLDGHAYALAATLDLLEQGATLGDLPTDPDGIAQEQWNRAARLGSTVQRLLTAHAVLEVPVPDAITIAVAKIEPAEHRSLLADPFVSGLLLTLVGTEERDEPIRRIYHSLLSNYVRDVVTEDELRDLHHRAAEIYTQRLQQERPDSLAALRRPGHERQAHGEAAFIAAALESIRVLHWLGLLDEAVSIAGAVKNQIDEDSSDEATLYNHLGLISWTRSDLEEAERRLRRALEIDQHQGNLGALGRDYGNLGLVHLERNELQEAEEMFRQSLEVSERFGSEVGMTNAYGNLGLIFEARGELDSAEQMFQKVMEIEERLGRPRGIASAYGNLAMIHRNRGNLEEAERLIRESLEINERLGRLDGMANAFGNLGLVLRSRGDLQGAERMLRRSLGLEERLGRLDGMVKAYGNLGLIYQLLGDLDMAEQMHKKSLKVNEHLGRLKGMATDYVNLGLIHQKRGDSQKAQEMLRKSLELFQGVGAEDEAVKVAAVLSGLPENGDE